MGAVRDIRTAKGFKERKHSRMHTQAQVWMPLTIDDDFCFKKIGRVIFIMRLEEGLHEGKLLYALRFETQRGHIIHGYLEEELKFV